VEAHGIPEPVWPFREALKAVDALLIATPEYNWSIPGVLKNALDWASRKGPDLQAPLDDKVVAIMGAGGIGFDVAELITHAGISASLDIDVFAKEWGIDFKNHPRGGVTGVEPVVASSGSEVFLLQRKASAVGKGLGRTTGWTHRITLQRRGVQMLSGVEYQRIDDDGLHILIDGVPQTLAVDTIIICAGQESARGLYDQLLAMGVNVDLIGGAYEAAELDAKRAIKQATELAVII
jgi:2,4-dienoyl-CoA reductase (NADPH2)